jgi:hypothetical protein
MRAASIRFLNAVAMTRRDPSSGPRNRLADFDLLIDLQKGVPNVAEREIEGRLQSGPDRPVYFVGGAEEV